MGIGFLGTGILIAPGLIGQPLRATTVGTLAVAAAAASYAVAALFQRRRLRGVSPLQVGFWQLALTTPLALAVASPTIGATHLSLVSVAAMLFLGVGGSGLDGLVLVTGHDRLRRAVARVRATARSDDRLRGRQPE